MPCVGGVARPAFRLGSFCHSRFFQPSKLFPTTTTIPKRQRSRKRGRVATSLDVEHGDDANTAAGTPNVDASHPSEPLYRVFRSLELESRAVRSLELTSIVEPFSLDTPLRKIASREDVDVECEPRKRFVPGLTPHGNNKKGNAGRIAVIGGCAEYTGAPYFAAISALRTGADLVHVFCTKGASSVIKTYSPDIIVHPYLIETDDLPSQNTSARRHILVKDTVSKTNRWLSSVDAIVIGPGLGRDEVVQEQVVNFFRLAHEQKIPLVVDADGLFLVANDPELVKGNPNAVLTPNANEFSRLVKTVLGRDVEQTQLEASHDERLRYRGKLAEDLSVALGGVGVLSKGDTDVGVCAADERLGIMLPGALPVNRGIDVNKLSEFIYERRKTKLKHALGWFGNSESGSPRRCGGQGDILAGTLAIFLAWASTERYRNYLAMTAQFDAAYLTVNRNRVESPASKFLSISRRDFVDEMTSLTLEARRQEFPQKAEGFECMLLDATTLSVAEKVSAMCHASRITRDAASVAFAVKKRSMVTADIIDKLGHAFEKRFPVAADSYATEEEIKEEEWWGFGNIE